MTRITTNEDVRKKRIDEEVKRVIKICFDRATDGRSYAYVHLPRDIQREVRDILGDTTNIFVAINYATTPSRHCVEYIDENNVEVKFTWS